MEEQLNALHSLCGAYFKIITFRSFKLCCMPFFPILFPSIHARRKEDKAAPAVLATKEDQMLFDGDTTVIQGYKFSNQLIKFHPEVVEFVLQTVSKSHPIG